MKREVARVSVEDAYSNETEAITSNTSSQHDRTMNVDAERRTAAWRTVSRTCAGLG